MGLAFAQDLGISPISYFKNQVSFEILQSALGGGGLSRTGPHLVITLPVFPLFLPCLFSLTFQLAKHFCFAEDRINNRGEKTTFSFSAVMGLPSPPNESPFFSIKIMQHSVGDPWRLSAAAPGCAASCRFETLLSVSPVSRVSYSCYLPACYNC